jgi:hypothetical protein
MLAKVLAFLVLVTVPVMAQPKPYIDHIQVDLSKQMLYEHWTDNRKVKPIPVSTGYSRKGIKCITGNEHNCTEHYHGHVIPLGGPNFKSTEGYPMSYYVQFDARRSEGIHSGEPVVKGNTESHGCVRVLGDANVRMVRYNVNKNTILDIYGIPPN